MMEKIEQDLKGLILKNVKFTLGSKTYKEGVVKVFNTKQFFIRFKLESGEDMKEVDIPYPYSLRKEGNSYCFDYCLSAICPPTETVFYKMKLLDKSSSSKLHDTHMWVTPLSA